MPSASSFFRGLIKCVKFCIDAFKDKETNPEIPQTVGTDVDIERQAESCRAEAKAHAQKRGEYFEQSQAAFKSGEKQRAKELSENGKKQGELMNAANKKASQLYLQCKNEGRDVAELDLHGQFVNESLEIARSRIQLCRKEKLPKLVIIFGKSFCRQ
jgi:DNA-nicking Smr family endonuclease